jgi:uncharacterized membrane protein
MHQRIQNDATTWVSNCPKGVLMRRNIGHFNFIGNYLLIVNWQFIRLGSAKSRRRQQLTNEVTKPLNLDHLTAANPNVLVHAGAALLALLLGIVQFVLIKGTRRHKLFGYIWVALMYCVAITSLFINNNPWIGPFGPIHILSVFVIVGLPFAVGYARRGIIRGHQLYMAQLFGFGLIGAGAFAALEPGRLLYRVIFG